MQSMRLMGVVLVAATWMSFHSSTARADVTVWSTSATACVPVSTSGLSVTPVAVTAAAGVTVTLNCAITKGSSTITTEVNLCQGSSIIDFNKNFYSLRIVLKSGITTGSQMTVYGSSLVIH
jgi:hypothetical protein